MSEIDEAIAEVKRKAEGRTRYEERPPYRDEILVAEIERLRLDMASIARMKVFPDDKINRATLAAAITIAKRASEQEAEGSRKRGV